MAPGLRENERRPSSEYKCAIAVASRITAQKLEITQQGIHCFTVTILRPFCAWEIRILEFDDLFGAEQISLT